MSPRKRPAAAAGILKSRRGVAPKAKAEPQAKARARARGRSHRRPGKPLADDSSSWKPVQDWNPQIGEQVHLRGTYRGEPSECVGEVEGLVEDREGLWVKLALTGSPHEVLREWRRSHTDEFYVNRKPLLKSLDPQLQELFCVHDAREVDPMLEWKSNLLDLRGEAAALPGLASVARDLGYGVFPGGVGPSAPSPHPQKEDPGAGGKPKKLKGKARIKCMIKASRWEWGGSSLDPNFRKPRVSLKRKREQSSSSNNSSSQSGSPEVSDQEDLFPEEAQCRHISRKCPGLLARYAIKEARKRIFNSFGDSMEDRGPVPVFVKYYRQVFNHSGVSTPMKREYLTLAHCLDALLEGDVLRCLDVGVQRLKAVEQISQGVPPVMANRLELIPPDVSSLATAEESRTAAQEHRREEKVKASWTPPKGKGRWDHPWARTAWEDVLTKGDKGGKAMKGKEGKGKPGGKGRPAKGAPAQASEVIAVKE